MVRPQLPQGVHEPGSHISRRANSEDVKVIVHENQVVAQLKDDLRILSRTGPLRIEEPKTTTCHLFEALLRHDIDGKAVLAAYKNIPSSLEDAINVPFLVFDADEGRREKGTGYFFGARKGGQAPALRFGASPPFR